MENLASTCQSQGRWKEAEELNVQGMETRKKVLGQDHLDILSITGSLALTYRNQRRTIEAVELEVRLSSFLYLLRKHSNLSGPSLTRSKGGNCELQNPPSKALY